jgi:pimeloyl-ACP methyl ester carboxylesterase
VSVPRALGIPEGVHPITVETARGPFAALAAMPGAGRAERQPALLVPGFTGSKEDFLLVLRPLAQAGRRVVAIDMRGQYESPAAPDASGYRLAELAADLAAVADTLAGVHRVHLLGHSFGGLVARELVVAGAAPIGSLALMSSGPGALTGLRADVLRAVLADLNPAAPGGLAAEVKRLWDTHMEPMAVADGNPPDVIDFLRTRLLHSCPTGLSAMARELLSCPDRTPALAAASLPALVIYGEDDDAWAPAVQDEMAHRLGAARVRIPAAGHSLAMEAPAAVASALTRFWNSAESARD